MLRAMTTCGRAAVMAVCLLSTAAGQAPTPAASQQPPAAPEQAPAGRGRSAYQDAARLPVRIVSFTAEPNTIQRGQSVTLTWATENPGTITIRSLKKLRRATEKQAKSSDVHVQGE